MNRRHVASLLGAFFLAAGLAFCLSATLVRAESSPTAVARAPAASTPVTPLSPPGSPASSEDDVSNIVKYLVIAAVLGALAIAAGVLVVVWFLID